MSALARFHDAQNNPHTGFANALAELRAGRKTSHWIWYVFPQLAGLGHSANAQFYALTDIAAARAYLADSVLRQRLEAAAEAVDAALARGVPLVTLMGGATDVLKLVSSLALFESLAAAEEGTASLADIARRILEAAEAAGFPRCRFTQARFAAEGWH